jgi:hypothetical protein
MILKLIRCESSFTCKLRCRGWLEESKRTDSKDRLSVQKSRVREPSSLVRGKLFRLFFEHVPAKSLSWRKITLDKI